MRRKQPYDMTSYLIYPCTRTTASQLSVCNPMQASHQSGSLAAEPQRNGRKQLKLHSRLLCYYAARRPVVPLSYWQTRNCQSFA